MYTHDGTNFLGFTDNKPLAVDLKNRNARYIAISLRHDIQKAGVDIDSNITFGTVATWAGTYGDTLLILHVPYLPEPAPLHSLIPPTGTDDPSTGIENCPTCCGWPCPSW